MSIKICTWRYNISVYIMNICNICGRSQKTKITSINWLLFYVQVAKRSSSNDYGYNTTFTLFTNIFSTLFFLSQNKHRNSVWISHIKYSRIIHYVYNHMDCHLAGWLVGSTRGLSRFFQTCLWAIMVLKVELLWSTVASQLTRMHWTLTNCFDF